MITYLDMKKNIILISKSIYKAYLIYKKGNKVRHLQFFKTGTSELLFYLNKTVVHCYSRF